MEWRWLGVWVARCCRAFHVDSLGRASWGSEFGVAGKQATPPQPVSPSSPEPPHDQGKRASWQGSQQWVFSLLHVLAVHGGPFRTFQKTKKTMTRLLSSHKADDGMGRDFHFPAMPLDGVGTHTWAANGQWSAWYQNQLTNPDAVPIDSLLPCWASCPSSSSAGVGLVEAASKLVACSAFSLPLAPKPQPQGGPRGDALGEHGNTSTSRQHCRAWKWDLAGISIPGFPLSPLPFPRSTPTFC